MAVFCPIKWYTKRKIWWIYARGNEGSFVFPCLLSCLASCCLVLSCLVLSCLVLSCLVLSCLVYPCLSLSCLVLSCLVLSCLVLPWFVLSYFVLTCPVVSCRILSCLVLSCLVLSCLVLSCLVLANTNTHTNMTQRPRPWGPDASIRKYAGHACLALFQHCKIEPLLVETAMTEVKVWAEG